MTARRKTDPTKKMEIRVTTELVALTTALAGSLDSAAAIVAISVPTIEKITTTMLEKIAPTPNGKNPPLAVRLLKSTPLFGQSPIANNVPSPRNAMMAKTLIPANQNSNSPNEDTENRLVAVINTINPRESNHSGASIQ